MNEAMIATVLHQEAGMKTARVFAHGIQVGWYLAPLPPSPAIGDLAFYTPGGPLKARRDLDPEGVRLDFASLTDLQRLHAQTSRAGQAPLFDLSPLDCGDHP
jgi:hypothetical protein